MNNVRRSNNCQLSIYLPFMKASPYSPHSIPGFLVDLRFFLNICGFSLISSPGQSIMGANSENTDWGIYK